MAKCKAFEKKVIFKTLGTKIILWPLSTSSCPTMTPTLIHLKISVRHEIFANFVCPTQTAFWFWGTDCGRILVQSRILIFFIRVWILMIFFLKKKGFKKNSSWNRTWITIQMRLSGKILVQCVVADCMKSNSFYIWVRQADAQRVILTRMFFSQYFHAE